MCILRNLAVCVVFVVVLLIVKMGRWLKCVRLILLCCVVLVLVIVIVLNVLGLGIFYLCGLILNSGIMIGFCFIVVIVVVVVVLFGVGWMIRICMKIVWLVLKMYCLIGFW